jgi:hypothetical protein
MIIPKRTIPRVGVAALVLGGCGDDVDDPDSIAAAFCKFEERCDPGDFFDDYTSISECRATISRYISTYLDYYRMEYGPACADALEDYYICLGQDYADQNGDGTCTDLSTVVCSRESDRVEALCDF